MSAISRLLRASFSTSPEPTTATSIATHLIKSPCTFVYRERNLNRLVEKFKKCSENDRFRTKTGIYKDTIRRLAAAKHYRSIKDVLEDQKKYKDMSKEGFNARLMYLYGKSGLFNEAHKVFDEMPERNCKRTVLSFNALLSACVNSKQFDKIDGLFKELPGKLEIEPDLVSLNTIIKAFCEMGSLDSAWSMLDEIEKKGLEPDLITFNTLLNAFYANRRFLYGEKIWGQMKEKNVIPDSRSYNARLLGLAKEKKMEVTLELVEEMKNKDLKLDVFSINALLEGFVNDGNLVEAKFWYREMEKIDCKPDKVTFEALLPLACDKCDFEFAYELSKDIFKGKLRVHVALLQRVLDGLIKESKIDAAKELMELGKTNRYCRYKLKLP